MGKETQILVEQPAEWDPQPVRTFLNLKNALMLCGLQHYDTHAKYSQHENLKTILKSQKLIQTGKGYHAHGGPRQLSQYSDSLQTVRSEDRIQMVATFSAPVQTGSGVHPAS